MDTAHISDEEHAQISRLTPTEVQALASQVLQDDAAKMVALRDHTLAMKRIYNSAASINSKLPVEILVIIFRTAGPPSNSPKDAVWLTHVCHAWRAIIHDTPAFWVDFMRPCAKRFYIGSTMRHSLVILDALARSAPLRYEFGMYGDFLPALKTPAAESHLSRMSTLSLDCRALGDTDMRLFFELRLPNLEQLALWSDCTSVALPDISAESPARFPRLRTLKTTCTTFPLAWVGPSLRTLEIVAGVEFEGTAPRNLRRERCCHLSSVSELFRVLGRCPNLEVLAMSDCLPYDITPHDSSALVLSHHPPRLEHLDCFKIDSTELGAVRSLLECFTLPHETFLTLYTDSAYDALSECLPVTHRLQSIPFIDQVELNVCRPEHKYPHVVEGFAPEEKDGLSRTRLAVHSSDTSILHRDFDLLRLFKGFAPIFLPGVVVDLMVTLSQPLRRGQSEAWAWLLRYFPRITNLSVEAASNIEFFTVLAEDVMSELSSLSVTLVGADDWVIEREVTVSVLEIRAFRGLHLRSFVYREQVKRGLGELPPSLPTSYVERLQAVCSGGKVLEPYYVD